MSEKAVEPQETGAEEQGTDPKAPPAVKGEGKEPETDAQMIPKARLDAVLGKNKDMATRLAEYEAAEKAAEDEEAKKAGQIDKFQTERDQFKEVADHWEGYGAAKLESLQEGLSDESKAILAELEDQPLHKRLSIAEKLAAKPDAEPTGKPGFGGSAGGQKIKGGVIPSSVASQGEYHSWLTNLSMSTDPEDQAILRDSGKMADIRKEARDKGFV